MPADTPPAYSGRSTAATDEADGPSARFYYWLGFVLDWQGDDKDPRNLGSFKIAE